MRRTFGYRPADVRSERGLVIVDSTKKWGRQRFGSRSKMRGNNRLIAYTIDSAGRSIRLFFQRETDHNLYGDNDWPIEARHIADVVPGFETEQRVPSHILTA